MSDSVKFSPDLYRGTATDYDQFRIPYPQPLIDDLVARTNPSGGGGLLDLACGTGQLAFALLDRFDRVWAVDQEPDMVAVVRAKAVLTSRESVRAIASPAEDLAAPAGAFELVTIGNAFHRLERERIAENLVRWLRPGGHVAIAWSASPWDGERPWHAALGELMDRWMVRVGAKARVPPGWDEVRRTRPDRAVLADAGLEVVGSYRFPTGHEWTSDTLTGFVYSTSVLPRTVVGDEQPAFERELRDALAPYAVEGKLPQTIDFAYELARRPAGGSAAEPT